MSKTKLRELIALIFKFYTVFQIGLIIIGVINVIFLETTKSFLVGFILIGIATIVVELCSVAGVCITYYIKNNLAPEKTNLYERDIPKEIPPAIASLLLDFYAEEEQDYLSTVASLISKGYIEIVGNKEIIVKNNNLDGLLEHEILAFDIVTKKTFYTSKEFRDNVTRDAKKLGLIERTNGLIKKWKNIGYCIRDSFILFVVFIIVIGSMGELEKYGVLEDIVWFFFIVFGIVYSCKIFKAVFTACSYNSPGRDQSLKYIYEKTSKGKKYAEKIAGLRNFLKEYTLINEKELDSIIIYEDYIPYAIALGEADAIARFIEQDSRCRRLIYRSLWQHWNEQNRN